MVSAHRGGTGAQAAQPVWDTQPGPATPQAGEHHWHEPRSTADTATAVPTSSWASRTAPTMSAGRHHHAQHQAQQLAQDVGEHSAIRSSTATIANARSDTKASVPALPQPWTRSSRQYNAHTSHTHQPICELHALRATTTKPAPQTAQGPPTPLPPGPKWTEAFLT